MSNKGTLHPGTDTDLVLFDPDERYTITADDSPSKQDFTIYDGREMTGRAVRFSNGRAQTGNGEMGNASQTRVIVTIHVRHRTPELDARLR